MTIRDLLKWNSITSATIVVVMVLLLSGLIVFGVVHRRARASMIIGVYPVLQSGGKSESITVCQLMSDPARYNQQVVQVTGFFSHGFEDSTLFDPSCDSRFSIWFEYGGTNKTGTMYCCGVSAARTTKQPVTVENIRIPLKVDDKFLSLDNLLHGRGDSIAHATVIGRFFSGKKEKSADGRDWWRGYGHMGCCSLFMIQEVVSVDLHDRLDLDYGASADSPNLGKDGCNGYRYLGDFNSLTPLTEAQRQADSGERAWAFDDPNRVAIDYLASSLKLNAEVIQDLKLKRKAQGRMVYEWKRPGVRRTYLIVISKPYVLAFYAKTKAVVWVTTAAYESSCDP